MYEYTCARRQDKQHSCTTAKWGKPLHNVPSMRFIVHFAGVSKHTADEGETIDFKPPNMPKEHPSAPHTDMMNMKQKENERRKILMVQTKILSILRRTEFWGDTHPQHGPLCSNNCHLAMAD